jgi:hypothetical protein
VSPGLADSWAVSKSLGGGWSPKGAWESFAAHHPLYTRHGDLMMGSHVLDVALFNQPLFVMRRHFEPRSSLRDRRESTMLGVISSNDLAIP